MLEFLTWHWPSTLVRKKNKWNRPQKEIGNRASKIFSSFPGHVVRVISMELIDMFKFKLILHTPLKESSKSVTDRRYWVTYRKNTYFQFVYKLPKDEQFLATSSDISLILSAGQHDAATNIPIQYFFLIQRSYKLFGSDPRTVLLVLTNLTSNLNCFR